MICREHIAVLLQAYFISMTKMKFANLSASVAGRYMASGKLLIVYNSCRIGIIFMQFPIHVIEPLRHRSYVSVAN